jgi:hypothetical protein
MTTEDVDRYFSLCPVGSYVMVHYWQDWQYECKYGLSHPAGLAFGILERM